MDIASAIAAPPKPKDVLPRADSTEPRQDEPDFQEVLAEQNVTPDSPKPDNAAATQNKLAPRKTADLSPQKIAPIPADGNSPSGDAAANIFIPAPPPVLPIVAAPVAPPVAPSSPVNGAEAFAAALPAAQALFELQSGDGQIEPAKPLGQAEPAAPNATGKQVIVAAAAMATAPEMPQQNLTAKQARPDVPPSTDATQDAALRAAAAQTGTSGQQSQPQEQGQQGGGQDAAAGAERQGQQPATLQFNLGGPQDTAAPTTATSATRIDAQIAIQSPPTPPVNAPQAAPSFVAQSAAVLVPPEALGVTIARKVTEGINRFDIRLDPPELGRLDVTIEVDESGQTRAHIRAERPEAIDLLQREAKGMELALRQAGIQLDQGSLTFSLNDRAREGAQEHSHHGRRTKFHAVLPADEIDAATVRASAPGRSGLDLHV